MNGLKDITVLITAAGNVFMPGTTACITDNGERNVRLIGADMNDDRTMLQMCDTYYPVPRGDDPSYIDTLLEICKKESVDILIPIMSVELNTLAENRSRFKEVGTVVSVSDIEALRISNNKLNLFNYMKSQGIPCAEYSAINSIEELDEAVKKMGYPQKKVCIKATSGSGSRGFRILDESRSRFDMFMNDKASTCYTTLNEIKDILAETEVFPELIVMEYLPGNEYTIDLVADHGRVLYNCCRKSLGMENSIMLDGIVVNNEQALSICKTVTEKLGLDGNIGFDVKENEYGRPLIMECNPRVTAGIPVFAAAGVNLPYLNIKRLLGEELPVCKLIYGTIVKRRWKEMYISGIK